METGRIYNHGGEEYRLQSEEEGSWWGELIFVEYTRAADGPGYVLELNDGRCGACIIKKRINKAVQGIPPRYYYYIKGLGRLEGR